ncbi:group II intron reverse transcriptase/maturase, partial [Virgibacillus dakarensis]|nr:group II intron reverse transcriptase/maturase [Virgibacillus dakarensis]
LDIEDLIIGLNRKLQGFKNYYLTSPIAKKWLNRIDWYVLERLTIFWNRKRNKRHKHSKMGEVIEMTKYKLVKLAS